MKTASTARKKVITVEDTNEERMRTLANLIIDRILEDKKKGKLRFTST